MSTDVIIPSWVFDDESMQLVEECIDNIREVTGTVHDYRLILTHTGPLPKNADQADMVITMEPVQGWAASLNHAFMVTDGEFIVAGSTDIRVRPGWLEEMLRLGADGNTVVSPIDVKKGERRVWDATERGSFWGGWYLFPRTALERVGLLDGYAFRHMADMDWGLRAKQSGLQTVRALKVKAKHIRPHHTLKRRAGDPMNAIVRERFIKKWGTTHLGAWERGN